MMNFKLARFLMTLLTGMSLAVPAFAVRWVECYENICVGDTVQNLYLGGEAVVVSITSQGNFELRQIRGPYNGAQGAGYYMKYIRLLERAPKPQPPAPKPQQPKPAPAKPEPVKPTPAPVQPAPVKPTPAPAKPEPVKPEPVKPAPVKPEPAKPEPVRPTPAPAKPEPVKPAPAKPEPAKPTPAKPEPAKPEPAKPEPVKPKPSAPANGNGEPLPPLPDSGVIVDIPYSP